MKMSTIALVFSVLLIALGIFGFASYHAPTALIPAYAGIILAICGGVATKPEWRMHAMHGAALVGVLGFLFSVSGWLSLPALLSGAEIAKPHAVVMKSIMAALCLLFTVLCVKSFIDVRIARRKAAAAEANN